MEMAEENGEKQPKEVPVLTQIVQHAVNAEPSKLKNLVNKEIASRVMGGIDARRAVIAKKLFGQ